MLASDFVPKEGISLLGVDGVPASAWINPLLSIRLEWRKRKTSNREVSLVINAKPNEQQQHFFTLSMHVCG